MTTQVAIRAFRVLHRKLGSLAPLFYALLLLGLLWSGIGSQKRDEIYHRVSNTRDHLVDRVYDTRDVFVHKAFDARNQIASQVHIAKKGLVDQAHEAKAGIYSRAHNALNKLDEAKENIYSRVQDVQHQVSSKAYDTRDRIVNKAQDTWEKGRQVIDRAKAKIPQPTDIIKPPTEQIQPEREVEQAIEDDEVSEEIIAPEIPHSNVGNTEPDTNSPVEEIKDHDVIPEAPRVNWSAFSPSSFSFPKLSWPKVNLDMFRVPAFTISQIPMPQLPELPSIDIRDFIPIEWFKAIISKVYPPSFEIPEINLHQFLPTFNWPTFDLTSLNLPNLQLGKLEWPTFELPKLSLQVPTFSLPEIHLPNITLPKFPTFTLPTWDLANLLPEFSWPDFSRLNPFSLKPSSGYQPLPPTTLAEFRSRLGELEDSIRDLAIVTSVLIDESETMTAPGTVTAQNREKLLQDLYQIRNTLDQELEAVTGQNEVVQKLAAAISSREKELMAIERQVEGLGSEMNFVEKQVQEINQNVVGVNSHMKQLHEELARTSDWNNVKQQIIAVLERELPTHLVIQRKENGAIVMSQEFYTQLTNLLLAKDEADRAVDTEVENQKQHLPRHDHQTRWVEYFEENKQLLSQLVQDDLEEGVKYYTDKGIIVHRNDFLSIVEPHLEQLKSSLTAHVDMDISNVEKEMEDELEKTKADREERRQKHLNTVRLIEDMIQSSLSKHTADTIARPDFALHSSGAKVVTKLTTRTYMPQAGSALGKLAQAFGMNTPKNGNPPAIAMHPDTHLGKCWAFSGSQGQLTIQLSRTINVTDFTIEHVDQQVAMDLRSAPKELEVYGLVPKLTGKDNEEPEVFEEFLLAQYEFDIKQSRIQTFAADSYQKLYQPVKYVQLRVLSNHGHPDFTCIYRFRVHGKLSEDV